MVSFNDIAHKLNLINRDQYLFNSAPKSVRENFLKAVERREDLKLYQDITDATKAAHQYEEQMDRIFSKTSPVTSIQHFEPTGSTIRKMFPGPFAPFSYIGDNYWAAFKARRENRIEILRDGYVLVAPEGVNKKKIKLINDILTDLDIRNFRADAADFLNVFGNVWIDPSYNKLGGISKLNFLLPENITPTLDRATDRINGWDYRSGVSRVHFSLSEIDHLKTYSLRSLDLGFPSLAPVLIDVEADMFASLYGVTMFKKGGLIRAIVGMKDIQSSGVITDNNFLDFLHNIQLWFEKLYGGLRGAGEVVFTPNIEGVYNLVNPKDIEGAHARTSDKTASKVCELLGCPPERIGIPTTSQYQNATQVNDTIALSFDNNNYYLCGIVDNYINNKIIKEILKEDKIKIQMSGEFGSLTKVQAEFAKIISEAGALTVTVDEFRTKCLHWEPLGGELGAKFLGELAMEIEMMKATKPATASKDFMNTLSVYKNMKFNGMEYHHPKHIQYY